MEDGRDRDLSLLQETRTNTWFFRPFSFRFLQILKKFI